MAVAGVGTVRLRSKTTLGGDAHAPNKHARVRLHPHAHTLTHTHTPTDIHTQTHTRTHACALTHSCTSTANRKACFRFPPLVASYIGHGVGYCFSSVATQQIRPVSFSRRLRLGHEHIRLIKRIITWIYNDSRNPVSPCRPRAERVAMARLCTILAVASVSLNKLVFKWALCNDGRTRC